MGYFDIHPNTCKSINFIIVPEGEHRVQIKKVRLKRYRNERKCFEITFKVSRCQSLLWHYLWFNPEYNSDPARAFKKFFDAFDIQDKDLANYKDWIGKQGAVNVRYVPADKEADWNDEDSWEKFITKITYFLDRKQCDKLPPWSDVPVCRIPEDIFR